MEQHPTKNVDVNSCSGTATSVDSLNDIGGCIRSGCVCNGKCGVSRFCVNANPILWFQDKISLCPFHSWLWLAKHISRQVNLSASPGSQACKKLHIQLDLWWLCKIIKI